METEYPEPETIIRGVKAYVMAFSGDGTRLALRESEQVSVYDVARRSLVRAIPIPSATLPVAIALDHRGERVAFGEKTVRIYDVASGKRLASLAPGRQGTSAVQFSADGARIATGTGENWVPHDFSTRLYDARSGALLARWPAVASSGPPSAVVAVRVNGDRVTSIDHDCNSVTWELGKTEPVHCTRPPTRSSSRAGWGITTRHHADCTPDGTLAVGSVERVGAFVWDCASGLVLFRMKCNTEPEAVAVVPGLPLMAMTWARKIMIFDWEADKMETHRFDDRPRAVVANPAGPWVAWAVGDEVQLLEVERMGPARAPRHPVYRPKPEVPPATEKERAEQTLREMWHDLALEDPDRALREFVADPELLGLMLAVGADPNAEPPHRSSSVLGLAVGNGYTESIRLLLEAGADPNWYRADAEEPSLRQRILFMGLRHLNGTRALLKSDRLDVSVVDERGYTALMYAVERRLSKTLIRLLLARGIDPHHCAPDGKTAFDLAPSADIRQLLGGV